MKATYEITLTLNIVQDIETVQDVLDPHNIATAAANQLCTVLKDYNAVTNYDIKSGRIDIK